MGLFKCKILSLLLVSASAINIPRFFCLFICTLPTYSDNLKTDQCFQKLIPPPRKPGYY